MKMMDFTSTRRYRGEHADWRVILLRGDRYGRGGVFEVSRRRGLRLPAPIDQEWADKSRIEFYMYFEGFPDQGFPAGEDYQFVSSYYLTSILGLERGQKPLRLALLGLDLVGYEPAWKLSADDMARVFAWVLNVLPPDDPDIDKNTREELLVELDSILETIVPFP
jgi:hypothetical protein